jgi:hypothetical protein
MKNLTIMLAILTASITSVTAQENKPAAATQSAKMSMSNAIDITFRSNNLEAGDVVTLAFDDVNDYANGVESDPIELKIRSNKKFNITAKAASSRFSYNGNATADPKMSVNKLLIKVVKNNTGGNVPGNVNNKYKSMSASKRKLINAGTPGGDNTFAVQYKADPGYDFPAGTYSVDIIYTATQL